MSDLLKEILKIIKEEGPIYDSDIINRLSFNNPVYKWAIRKALLNFVDNKTIILTSDRKFKYNENSSVI